MNKRKWRIGVFIELGVAAITLPERNVLKHRHSLPEKFRIPHVFHDAISHATLRMLYDVRRV